MDDYRNTFIQLAPDCPATEATIPPAKKDGKSIPQLEYELLSLKPAHYTQTELLFAVHLARLNLTATELKSLRKELRSEFFGKSRACLRASMLPKKYGWGLHFDARGRITLVPMNSPDYKKFAGPDSDLSQLIAMRNKRN